MEIHRVTVTPLRSNCFILKSEGELVVIDPGGDPERILRRIDEFGGRVVAIVATHYHFDHTGAVEEIRSHYKAPFMIHENEVPFMKDTKADRLLIDGDEIACGAEVLQVIHTPGHTPGSICMLGDGFVITGDTLFQHGYGRTDFPGGSEEEMLHSLAKLEKILVAGMTVYPGHGLPFEVKV
ncbi:MBL fold metallo-hydrolase [Coprothermobacteraceae bacterium]|nr:MBL fold metallo-hydrolase [Coprothermobacteraceae bacterium]